MPIGLAYTYKLQIDFGHGGSYSHALADVTARWMNFNLVYGFQDPYGVVAPPSKLTFRLRNNDGLLTPSNTSSAFYGLLTRGTLVKITATYNGTTYINWTGKIASIKPRIEQTADPQNNAVVDITAEDPMQKLLKGQIFPKLQTSVTINAALTAIMNSTDMPVVWPYASSWAVLDVSVMGTARLYSPDLLTASVSSTTLPYVGDNASDRYNSVGMGSYITDLMMAECGGRFFWNGSKFEFQDRYYSSNQALSPGVALTLYSDDLRNADYRYGEDLVNAVTVTFEPRQVGSVGTVLYSAPRVITLRALDSLTVNCQYRDPNTPNARIGALTTIDPVAGTDYIANTASDGSGSNVTAYITASLQAKAQSASVTLVNPTGIDVYITTLQVRGTPLYTYERQTVTAVDAQSVYDNDPIPQSYNVKLIGDVDTALGYAQTQVARFKDAIDRFQSIRFIANTTKLLTASVSIGSLITVNDNENSRSNHTYVVVGIQHQADAAKREHYTTYTLSPLGRDAYWLLGVAGSSELDDTAIIAL